MADLLKAGTVRWEKKIAGRPPRFSFAVPTSASSHVAFQLTKAGMKDYEVVHFEDDEVSVFAFKSEPELHVAEDIVKDQFADQIQAGKGMWRTWAPQEDIMALPEANDRKQKPLVSSFEKEIMAARAAGKYAGQWGDRSYDSDQVHDVLDEFRVRGEDTNVSFDDALPEGVVPDVLAQLEGADDDTYLGTVVWMVSHGDNVPTVARERARQIAFAMVQSEEYLSKWKNPKLRKVELENEIELLEGPTQVASWDKYRRAKLAAWGDELGMDITAELKAFDKGDFAGKDRVFANVSEMVKQERRFSSHYRRNPTL